MQNLAFTVLLVVWQCYFINSAPTDYSDTESWKQAALRRNAAELIATGPEAELLLGCANIDDMLKDIFTERGMSKTDIQEILTSLQHKFAQVETGMQDVTLPRRVFKKSAAFWRPLGGLAIETRLSSMGRKMRPIAVDANSGTPMLRYGK